MSSGFEYYERLDTESVKDKEAVLKIVTEAVNDEDVYFYAAIRNHKKVIQHFTDEGGVVPLPLLLLNVLSYGNLNDYNALTLEDSRYNKAVLHAKMQVLSFLSYCATVARGKSRVYYNDLQPALGCSSRKEVEQTLMKAISADLLKGALDQENNCVHVHSVSGRDVLLADLDQLINNLRKWEKKCEAESILLERQTL
ncbi:COP9 signalosome complex subunit 7 [Angomonas deanei]|uniref:PCI domain containing protein, putative n=1 Tax=Angomonas deanei TaxID=59799 RepID=A0A7G2CCK2_9TRYP|nr:COP9 signalosome complex subunit 7 [Angomonas deanei]CAD2217165.1 PCI domain containing protein, putative [Angomonas deanei]|eukprot:EPY24061.1 COP9 signalosome complex subunit 7 [Angomonas deanei]